MNNLPDWLWRQMGCSETPCAPHGLIDDKVLLFHAEIWHERAERAELLVRTYELCLRRNWEHIGGRCEANKYYHPLLPGLMMDNVQGWVHLVEKLQMERDAVQEAMNLK